LLRLDEHVVEEAHVHGLQDRDDDRAAESDGDRNQVEVARHAFPGPPGGEGARERDGDRGVRGRHQVMFFASTSANLSRNSRAVSLPTSACWKSGTPSESSLPPHPAWARYGLTIENGKDLMKPAQDGSLANSGRSARVLRAGRRPRASQYSKFGAPSMSH